MKGSMVVQLVRCIGCGVLLIAGSACGPSPKEDAAAFANVTNIVFSDDSGLNDRGEFSVNDPESMRLMVSTIQLKQKKPCDCAHTYGAVSEGVRAEYMCDL